MGQAKKHKYMADSIALPVVTAGGVRRGFGFYQPFQPKVNIFSQNHTATAVKRVGTLKGQVPWKSFLSYLHLV